MEAQTRSAKSKFEGEQNNVLFETYLIESGIAMAV
jgi:hypothetical protein